MLSRGAVGPREAKAIESETLIERCRRGDDLAWEAFVRTHQRRIFAVAHQYMGNREEARDMAQEIFIRIYQRLDTFRGEERVLPWMLSVARNVCIDRLRRIRSRPPAHDLPVEEGPEVPSVAPSPEELTAESSRRRLLYRALEQLSEKSREIILLKEIHGLKLEEISTMLALPLGTVKSRSNRARIELASRVRGLDPSYGT